MPGRLSSTTPGKQRVGGLQFVDVDRMTHPGVDAFVDAGAHPMEDSRRFLHPFEWHVRIDVTGTDEDRRAREDGSARLQGVAKQLDGKDTIWASKASVWLT